MDSSLMAPEPPVPGAQVEQGVTPVDHYARWRGAETPFWLAFVGRHAEALEVLAANLANTAAIDAGVAQPGDAPFVTPVAGQPQGVGKTSLGWKLPVILRHPRDSLDAEAALAARLRAELDCGPWRAGAGYLEEALRDPRPENLVVRTLLAAFPGQQDVLLQLKASETLHPNQYAWTRAIDAWGSMDAGLARALLCAERNAHDYTAECALQHVFAALPAAERTAAGMVKAIIKRRGGGPVLLMLDGLGSMLNGLRMPHGAGATLRSRGDTTPALEHLKELSRILSELHAIRGCFVFSNASPFMHRSLECLQAHVSVNGKPSVRVQEIVMRPLQPDDVLQAMRETELRLSSSVVTSSGPQAALPSLADAISLAVAPELLPRVASTAVRISSGSPHMVQGLLTTLAQHGLARLPPPPPPTAPGATSGARPRTKHQRKRNAGSEAGADSSQLPVPATEPAASTEAELAVLLHAYATEAVRHVVPRPQVWWEGPSKFASPEKTLPAWAASKAAATAMAQLLVRAQLLGVSFPPEAAVSLPAVYGDHRDDTGREEAPAPLRRQPVLLRDAAVAMHYPLQPAPGGRLSACAGSYMLRHTAAFYEQPFAMHLLAAMAAVSDTMHPHARARATGVALDAAPHSGALGLLHGAMRGRPLLLLCAEAVAAALRVKLSYRYESRDIGSRPLGKLFPFLEGSAVGKCCVNPVAVKAVPAVSPLAGRPQTPGNSVEPLTAQQRRALEHWRYYGWKGDSPLHAHDLPWLLASWLQHDTLALAVSGEHHHDGRASADAPDGDSDSRQQSELPRAAVGHELYLRVDGGLLAFAPYDKLAWQQLEQALAAIPQLSQSTPAGGSAYDAGSTGDNGAPDGQPDSDVSFLAPPRTPKPAPHYTLVVLALELPLQLQQALGSNAASAVFGSGTWQLLLGADGSSKLEKVAHVVDTSNALSMSAGADAGAASARFTVPDNAELVVVNPRGKAGLAQLMGQQLLAQLHHTGCKPEDVDITTLEKWASSRRAA